MKLKKYGAIVPSALSGNTTPEKEFLLQEITFNDKGSVLTDSKYNQQGELEERHIYDYNNKGSLINHLVEMPLDEVVEKFTHERNESDLLTEVTKYYGDDEGEKTFYEYNEKNIPVVIRYVDADGQPEMVETFFYNEKQEVVKKVVRSEYHEEQNKTHLYEFNDKGLLMKYSVLDQDENLLSETNYSYNNHDLEEHCVQLNSNGKKTLEIHTEYDENLRLTKKHTRGFYVRITTINYDEQGRILEELLSDENNFVISRNAFQYDENGRIAEEVLYETDLTRAGRDTHMIMRYEYES